MLVVAVGGEGELADDDRAVVLGAQSSAGLAEVAGAGGGDRRSVLEIDVRVKHYRFAVGEEGGGLSGTPILRVRESAPKS